MLEFWPEANIWPMLTEEELQSLADDIDKVGQQYPISLHQDKILDGRNRYLAITTRCKKVTLPVFETVNPPSLIDFVISRNEKRRHLNTSQRGHIAALALPFFEREARKRMATSRKSEVASIEATSQNRERGSKASEDAAKAFNTSKSNVERGKIVLKKGSKKLNEAVATGNLSLGKAEEIVKQYPSKVKQDIQVNNIAESKMVSRVKGLTGEIEWYTPRIYIDAAIDVMGDIDLDPASSEAAQSHVDAKQYFTIEDDGLIQQWYGRVFLNPPYAMPFIKQFVNKMIDSWIKGEMKEGILLTNNATDTEWFHNALAQCTAICFTRGRISFLEVCDGEMTEKGTPTHGQAFFYFGNNIDRFVEVFNQFGTILHCYAQSPMKAKMKA